jgi:small-conductance mechanosensitive channel
VLPDPEPAVRIADLGSDDIELEATFWTDSRRTDFQNTASFVRAAILAALKEAGVALPDPDVRVLVPGRRDRG